MPCKLIVLVKFEIISFRTKDCNGGAEKMKNLFVVKNYKMVMLIPIMIKQLLPDETFYYFRFKSKLSLRSLHKKA